DGVGEAQRKRRRGEGEPKTGVGGTMTPFAHEGSLMPSNALPPGPKGTLVGGSLRDFNVHRLDFFTRVAREYGPLASFRFGPRRMFFASAPDLIEQVLVTDAKHYIKHFGARAYKPVLGN